MDNNATNLVKDSCDDMSESSQTLSSQPSARSLIALPFEEEKVERPILTKRLTMMIPEALPLFSMPTKASMLEPEIKYKLNRMLVNRKSLVSNVPSLKKQGCRHIIQKDYQCIDCQSFIPQFVGSIFDTGGQITFLNIKYVNEFIDNIASNNNGQTPCKPRLIYENYKPKNVHEMREYILFTIDKSLTKSLKRGILTSEHIRIIGNPGCGKNLSSEIFTYIQMKRIREQSVLCSQLDSNSIGLTNEVRINDNDQSYSGIGPHCLLFDSFFESGNLERAEYVTATDYNLYLNVDTNTKGHQQWFYFKVKNTFKDKTYTFNIRNFTKPFSLYRQGMKILVKSKKSDTQWVPLKHEMRYWRTDIQRSGWRVPGPLNLDDEEDDDYIFDDINGPDGVAGQKLTQRKNTLPPNMKKKRRYFYCLTFKVDFDHDDDEAYFAYSTPYTYTQTFIQMVNLENQLIDSQKMSSIKTDLKIVESSDRMSRQIITRDIIYERKLLAKSLSGLPVPVITITSRKHQGIEYKKRQGICISARVHPGETNSNFVFDGLFRYLLTSEGQINLLQNYIFKLLPCLNPDGNVCGNYRSSLAGCDLNRQWILPNKDIHPIVFKAKEMLSVFSKERQLLIYCDLHCHSKKKNSFIYGCNTAANGGFTSWTKTRLLPRILANQTPLFNLKDCRFRIDPDKLGTARVIIWKEFGVTNSFTLENSFFGYQIGANDTQVFTPDDYRFIGESLSKSFVEYRNCLKQIEKELSVTHGWLKPKLLLEVTGIPAAQKIAEEQADKIKKEYKLKKIEEYKQSIGHHSLKEQSEQSPVKVITRHHQGSGSIGNGSIEKTRNLQKTVALNFQQVSTTIAVTLDVSKHLLHQKTNQSDSKLYLKKQAAANQPDKRQSSSDSTNDFSKKPQSITVQSSDTSKSLSNNKLRRDEITFKRKQVVRSTRKLVEGGRDSSLSSHNSKTPAIADWRNYFKGEELEQIFEQIEDGDDPNDSEDVISLSDDNASDDNLEDTELYQQVYMRGHLMQQEILDKRKAEESCERQVKQIVEVGKAEAQQKRKDKINQARLMEETEKNAILIDDSHLQVKSQSETCDDRKLIDVPLIMATTRTVIQKQNTLPLSYPHTTTTRADLFSPVQIEQIQNISHQNQTQDFINDEMRYQQVFDTQPQSKDWNAASQHHTPSIMFSMLNQHNPYQNNNQSFNSKASKVIYKKSNMELNLLIGVKIPVVTSANYVLKELQEEVRQPNANGFQQYIMNNIKYENQRVQKAYSRIGKVPEKPIYKQQLNTYRNFEEESTVYQKPARQLITPKDQKQNNPYIEKLEQSPLKRQSQKYLGKQMLPLSSTTKDTDDVNQSFDAQKSFKQLLPILKPALIKPASIISDGMVTRQLRDHPVAFARQHNQSHRTPEVQIIVSSQQRKLNEGSLAPAFSQMTNKVEVILQQQPTQRKMSNGINKTSRAPFYYNFDMGLQNNNNNIKSLQIRKVAVFEHSGPIILQNGINNLRGVS